MASSSNPLASQQLDLDPALQLAIRQNMDQIMAEKAGGTAQPLATAQSSPLSLNIGGKTYNYASQEALAQDIEKLVAAQQAAVEEARRSAQSAAPLAQPSSAPVFDMNFFADTLVKEPVKALGYAFQFTPEFQQLQQNSAVAQQQTQQLEVYKFRDSNPDYAATQQNNAIIGQIITSQRWPVNQASLEAAYALAVRKGAIVPQAPNPGMQGAAPNPDAANVYQMQPRQAGYQPQHQQAPPPMGIPSPSRRPSAAADPAFNGLLNPQALENMTVEDLRLLHDRTAQQMGFTS